jgi:hypothetical protein
MTATLATPALATAGKRIILEFETLEQALMLLKPWRAENSRAAAAARIHESLTAVGLQMELRVRGKSVAEFGDGAFRGSLCALLRGGAQRD